jgi:hypothetical protein
MEKTLLYYFPPICIIIFTFILIFIAPNTSRSLPNSKYWKSINYKKYTDYAEDIKNSIISQGIKDINYLKDKLGVILRERNLCQRKKIMHGLEYASIVSNFYFGIVNIFLFIIIVKNESNNKLYIRLIIIITGIISFILTLLYTIYSIYIFKNDIAFKEDFDNTDKIPKLNSNGAFAYLENEEYNYYTCIIKDNRDEDSFYIKYKDLGSNLYNSQNHKDINYVKSCSLNNEINLNTKCNTYFMKYSIYGDKCKYLYYYIDSNSNKKIYNKWLCSIVFSLLITIANIFLVISGFLLFKKNSEYASIS